MESELEELLLHNDTTLYMPGFDDYRTPYHYLMSGECMVGITLNTIMAITIIKNKWMHNRTYLVFLCYLIVNVGNLALLPFFVWDILKHLNHRIICTVGHSETIFQLFETLIMLILITDFIIDTTKLTDKALILTISITIIAAITMFLIIGCELEDSFFTVNFGVTFVLYLLVAIVIYKDVRKFFFGQYVERIVENKFRFAVVRIYAYVLFATELIIEYTMRVYILLGMYLLSTLISGYIFIYIIFYNKKFRISVFNLFKRNIERRDVDVKYNVCGRE